METTPSIAMSSNSTTSGARLMVLFRDSGWGRLGPPVHVIGMGSDCVANKNMTTTGDSSQRRGRSPRTKTLWNIIGVFILVFGGFLLGIPWWDSMGVETQRCEVVSAEPRTSSGGSRGSASTAGVLIETSCGKFDLSQRVTRDTREEIAASFVVGTEYDFDTGWFSRVVMVDLLDEIGSIRDYRLVE